MKVIEELKKDWFDFYSTSKFDWNFSTLTLFSMGPFGAAHGWPPP